MGVDNKGVIVLSGASSGIGLAISRILLLEGFSVIGIDKNFTNLEIEGENFKPITIDLSNLEGLSRALPKILSQIGQPIRALINNAGFGRMAFVEQLSVQDMKKVMEVNFLSHAIVTKFFLPTLKQQKGPRGPSPGAAAHI